MVLIMSLLNSYQTLPTYLVLFTIEDCSWHNVNTRILNEELMTKKKVETSQVGRKLALTAIFETSHKEWKKFNNYFIIKVIEPKNAKKKYQLGKNMEKDNTIKNVFDKP